LPNNRDYALGDKEAIGLGAFAKAVAVRGRNL
jgi:hypothetical protein